MRSAASHFSGLIRVIVFLVVVGLLVYAVVHWAHRSQKVPMATAPTQSQQSSQDNTATNSDKVNSASAASANSNNTKSSPSSKTVKSQKPSTIAGDNTKASPSTGSKVSSQPQPSMVPSTGLALGQAVVAALGLSVTAYAGYTYGRSRNWLAIYNK